jgi:hypothetical protein
LEIQFKEIQMSSENSAPEMPEKPEAQTAAPKTKETETPNKGSRIPRKRVKRIPKGAIE